MSVAQVSGSNHPMAFIVCSVVSFIMFVVLFFWVSMKWSIAALVWMCSFAFCTTMYLMFRQQSRDE